MSEFCIEPIDYAVAEDPASLRQRIFTDLATSNVALLTNVLDVYTCAKYADELYGDGSKNDPLTDRDVDLSAVQVESNFEEVGTIAQVLTDDLSKDSWNQEYLARSRLSTDEADSAKHVDGSHRAELKNFLNGEVSPGLRIVYQLTGEPSEVGVADMLSNDRNPPMRIGQLSVGDCWILPQDRFIGLPIKTADGAVDFARHPLHYAKNPTNRIILVQDIVFVAGAAVQAPYLFSSDVVSGKPLLTYKELAEVHKDRRSQLQFEQAFGSVRANYN